MNIDLYNTNDSNTTINKVLTNKKTYDIQIKEKVSLSNPVIVVKSDDFIPSNYAYIDEFKRFYFIERVEIVPNNIYRLYLRCDVLETYKGDILTCKGSITQQTKINNYYDGGYVSEVKKEVQTFKSDITNEVVETIVLTTIGG